jgi:hypothetical protein
VKREHFTGKLEKLCSLDFHFKEVNNRSHKRVPPHRVPRTDALPHWTRLVGHTGMTARDGSPRTDWLSRHE